MKINESIQGTGTSPFTPTSETLITFAVPLCSNKMLLFSLRFLSSDKKRQGRQRTSRTQTQGKRFMTLTEQMEVWCLSKLQQICVLSGEFPTLPAKNVKWRGLCSTLVFNAWIKDTWKNPPTPPPPVLFGSRVCIYSVRRGVISSYSTELFGLRVTLQRTPTSVKEWLKHRKGFECKEDTEQPDLLNTEGLLSVCETLISK